MNNTLSSAVEYFSLLQRRQYRKLCQASKIKLFAKMVNGFLPFNILAKSLWCLAGFWLRHCLLVIRAQIIFTESPQHTGDHFKNGEDYEQHQVHTIFNPFYISWKPYGITLSLDVWILIEVEPGNASQMELFAQKKCGVCFLLKTPS